MLKTGMDDLDQKNEERSVHLHNRINAQVEVSAGLRGQLHEHLDNHKRGGQG